MDHGEKIYAVKNNSTNFDLEVSSAHRKWLSMSNLLPLNCQDKSHGMYSRSVGSLVVRAPDSGPEGLGPIPVVPNSLRVHTEYMLVKSVGLKVLWAESRVQRSGENFPPRQFHA
ncbi:uncharacterized protein TNCV_4803411 [Trichonephila clavipes]|nr:uncharacterized protein TNCV_4803411 [Trichonephila clavipes]